MSTKGLEGIVVAETELSKIYGEEGRLIYRGYEIEDLAEHATFEEVAHLLWYGELPDGGELDALSAELVAARPLGPDLLRLLRLASPETHPMAVLRTAISALAFTDADADGTAPEALHAKALRVTAQAATITAAWARIRSGEEPIEPNPDLGHAANFLYMLRGEPPDELQARIMDVALTLHAEHGMNASTFSARVTIATLSDLYSAVTSAIGTLKGPLHGGANERVMKMLNEIGEPDLVEAWIQGALERGQKIMGFGHRVYRTVDPRAPILRELASGLSAEAGSTRWLELSQVVADVMRQEMEARGKKVYPNVDFYSASVYSTLGIPADLFPNVFACARVVGWTAHVMEQLQDNRLIRPKAEYVGPEGKRVKSIAARP